LWAICNNLLYTKLKFFTDEAWLCLSGYICPEFKTIIIGALLIQVPLHSQKVGVWGAVTAAQNTIY
jgi:hypothetical protein